MKSCFSERAYKLLIKPLCTRFTMALTALANGFVATAYSYTLTATGGLYPSTVTGRRKTDFASPGYPVKLGEILVGC